MTKYEQNIMNTLNEFDGSCMIQSIESRFFQEFIQEPDLGTKLGEALDSLLVSAVIVQPNANLPMFKIS